MLDKAELIAFLPTSDPGGHSGSSPRPLGCGWSRRVRTRWSSTPAEPCCASPRLTACHAPDSPCWVGTRPTSRPRRPRLRLARRRLRALRRDAAGPPGHLDHAGKRVA